MSIEPMPKNFSCQVFLQFTIFQLRVSNLASDLCLFRVYVYLLLTKHLQMVYTYGWFITFFKFFASIQDFLILLYLIFGKRTQYCQEKGFSGRFQSICSLKFSHLINNFSQSNRLIILAWIFAIQKRVAKFSVFGFVW